MTTSPLKDSLFNQVLPVSLKPAQSSSPKLAEAAEPELPETQPQDSVSASLISSRPAAPVAFVEEPSSAPVSFPDRPLKDPKQLRQLQVLEQMLQNLTSAKKLSQSIDQNQAAVWLLTQIHEGLDLGMSLDEAFYTHFELEAFKHMLSQNQLTPQVVLGLLADNARRQKAELSLPQAMPAKSPEQVDTALQLANEVLELTDELESRTGELEHLTEDSSRKRAEATSAAQDLVALKGKEAAQEVELHALNGLVAQLTMGFMTVFPSPAAKPAAAQPDAKLRLTLPSADLLKRWGVTISFAGMGWPVFAIAGKVVSNQELVIYLEQQEQKQAALKTASERAIVLKQTELSGKQRELANIEKVLRTTRKQVADTSQKLQLRRDQLLQHPQAATVPGYASLLQRSERALNRAKASLVRADQELLALQTTLRMLSHQLEPVRAAGSQSKTAGSLQTSAQPMLVTVMPQQTFTESSHQPDLIAEAEAANQAIDRQQARDILARVLDQTSTDSYLNQAREAWTYQQQKLNALSRKAG